MYFLLVNLLFLALLINLIFYIPAFSLKSDKFTDITYSLTFIFLSSTALFLSSNFSFENILLLIMIIVWATRLGLFLLSRILRIKKDKRFDHVRNNFLRFGLFWIIQAFTAWVLLIPTFLFFNFLLKGDKTSLFFGMNSRGVVFLFIGLIIWLLGLLIESIADYQKQNYIETRKINGLSKHWVDIGLWKYIRHPNYLGEVLIWFGIFVFTLSKINNLFAIVGLVSPVFIYILIRFFTGVPQVSASAENSFGNDTDFIEYKKNTGLIFPKFFN